jgi:predicted dehydrogenase
MEMPKLKFCIAGCGRIAALNVLGYKDHPEAEIYAVCDQDSVKAETLAAQVGAKKVYTDYQQMLDDRDIDAIDLLVPHHLHHDMAIAACNAKKHISVQKPMALTVTECDDMIQAAKSNKVKLKVFENFVFYPPIVKAKKLIEAGEIGDISTIRLKMVAGGNHHGWKVDPATWLWRMEEKTCGGGPLVFDDGYHKFSLAYHFLGQAEKIFAFIDATPIQGSVFQKPDGTKVQFYEDAPAIITWKAHGQRYGVFDITYSPDMEINTDYYSCDERVEITGTKGIIWVTRCTGKMLQEPSLTLYRNGESVSWHTIRDDWSDSFIDSTKDFIDALVKDRDPVLTGNDGREILRFAIGAMESGRTGLPVELRQFYDSVIG